MKNSVDVEAGCNHSFRFPLASISRRRSVQRFQGTIDSRMRTPCDGEYQLRIGPTQRVPGVFIADHLEPTRVRPVNYSAVTTSTSSESVSALIAIISSFSISKPSR